MQTSTKGLVAVALWVTTCMSPLLYSADIYVTTNGTHATGPSWANPTSLTNALAIASANDVIWMQEGTYSNSSTFTVSTDGLEIYGGFDGTETLLSERDITNHVVLLDGEATRAVLDVQADNVQLDGLVMTNGYTTTINGVGVRVDGYTNLTMRNCDILNNIQHRNNGTGGGAYFYNAGDVLLSNCVIKANGVTQRAPGPGFYSRNTDLTLIDCEVRGKLQHRRCKRWRRILRV